MCCYDTCISHLPYIPHPEHPDLFSCSAYNRFRLQIPTKDWDAGRGARSSELERDSRRECMYQHKNTYTH